MMRKLARFLRLPLADQGLLMEAAACLACCRFAVRLVPLTSLRQTLKRLATLIRTIPEKSPDAAVRIGSAVHLVSRCLPKATCLPQALAGEFLLLRRGLPARLRLGVNERPGGGIQAHAWLESGERIIVGGPDAPAQYASLLDRGDASL